MLLMAALWGYRVLLKHSLGEPSAALPVTKQQSVLDRLVVPLLKECGNQSGALFVSDPHAAFLSRAQSARVAERSIDVQYYLWFHDTTGRLLQEELLAAADRGVRVRMLLDDMSRSGRDEEFLALDAHPNIEVRFFNPWRQFVTKMRHPLDFSTLNQRMHNKAWIVDNRMALVGGRNIGDEYFGASDDLNFRDTDLLLLGPAVQQTSDVFDSFWNSAEVLPVNKMFKRGTKWSAKTLQQQRQKWLADIANSQWHKAASEVGLFAQQFDIDKSQIHWSETLKVISDPPNKANPSDTKRKQSAWIFFDVMALLYSARKSNWLISPYFIPGETGVYLLSGQCHRGLDVRVLTNTLAATDLLLVHASYKRYRKPLLQNNIQLCEFKKGRKRIKYGWFRSDNVSLHSKAFLVDEQRGFVGSYNLSPRSARLNTEMGVMFDHEGLAQQLKAFYLESTQPDLAWQLSLNGHEELQWHDGTTTLSKEPEASLLLRLASAVLGVLPLESQL